MKKSPAVFEYLTDLTLLCVEDEPVIQELYKVLFSDHFKEILYASNGADGLELMEKENVDIVITDYLMPTLNGLEMIKRIRGTNRDIPVILVTAIEEMDVLKQAINLNITHFLAKPIEMNELLSVVESAAKAVIADAFIARMQDEKIQTFKKREAYSAYQEELAFKKELNVIRNDFYYKLCDDYTGRTCLIDALYQPLDVLSGDSYSVRRIGPVNFYLLVDAMGKGVSASTTAMLLTSFVNYTLDRMLAEQRPFSLDEVLSKMLHYIQPILLDDEILSAHFIAMDSVSHSMRYCTFSMPAILMMDTDGTVSRLPSNNPPIDKYMTDFRINSVENKTINKILIYSDGLNENHVKGSDRLYGEFIEEDFKMALTRDDMARAIDGHLAAREDDITFIFVSNLDFQKYLVANRRIASTMDALGEANAWYEEKVGTLFADKTLLENAAYAFSELLQNAYEHGNLGIDNRAKHHLIESGEFWDLLVEKEQKCTKEIDVGIYHLRHFGQNYLLTRITDEGDGFDTEILREIFYRANNFNGRGVFISKKSSNGLYYNQKGNCVFFINKFTQ